MNTINESDLQKIIDLSVNVGAIYLQWAGLSDELTTKQIRANFVWVDQIS